MFMFEKAHQKITTITSANDLMKFTETKTQLQMENSQKSQFFFWKMDLN